MGRVVIVVSPAGRAKALRRALRDDSKVKIRLQPQAAEATATPVPGPSTTSTRTSTPVVVTAEGRARALRRALTDDSRIKVRL